MCCFRIHFSDFNVLFFPKNKKNCCSLLLKTMTCCAKRKKKITCCEEKSLPPPGYQMVRPLALKLLHYMKSLKYDQLHNYWLYLYISHEC